MTEIERKAIVWDLIEHLAFYPGNQESWLRRYSTRLRGLLQLEPVWTKVDTLDHFAIAELQIKCKYRIEDSHSYVATLKKMDDEKIIWSVHADETYLSKAALHRAPVDYPKSEISNHLSSDIQYVLDGMLFHPRNHTHLSDFGVTIAGDNDPACKMLKANDIRITSSAYNGFIFLYHLAYQLCVVSKEARANEKSRLLDVFDDAIKNKHSIVNASVLFKF